MLFTQNNENSYYILPLLKALTKPNISVKLTYPWTLVSGRLLSFWVSAYFQGRLLLALGRVISIAFIFYNSILILPSSLQRHIFHWIPASLPPFSNNAFPDFNAFRDGNARGHLGMPEVIWECHRSSTHLPLYSPDIQIHLEARKCFTNVFLGFIWMSRDWWWLY